MKQINLIKNEVERVNTKDRLKDHYTAYSYYIKTGQFTWAAHSAQNYNHLLKRLGGVSKNISENYLTLGFSR